MYVPVALSLRKIPLCDLPYKLVIELHAHVNKIKIIILFIDVPEILIKFGK
jgi:hypothetical protein